MSRRGSRASTTSSQIGAASAVATSTPIKRASAASVQPPQGTSIAGGSRSQSLSASAGGPQAESADATRGRNVHFSQSQRRSSAGSSSSEGKNAARLLSSFLDRSVDELRLDKGPLTQESMARLYEEESEDVRLLSLLSSSGAADAGLGNGLGPWPAPPPPRFPLVESVRHAQRDIRAMPVGDSALLTGEGEEPGNLTAAEVAAMMHSLEHGVSMRAPPEQLFKFLFPNASRGGVAVAEEASGQAEAGTGENRPEVEPHKSEEHISSAPNENTHHKDEVCPIVCFGGGGGGFHDNARAKARTLMQLRGDAPPPWFPGYYMALPETGGAIQVMSSPADVMQAAYLAARPRNVPPEARFVY